MDIFQTAIIADKVIKVLLDGPKTAGQVLILAGLHQSPELSEAMGALALAGLVTFDGQVYILNQSKYKRLGGNPP